MSNRWLQGIVLPPPSFTFTKQPHLHARTINQELLHFSVIQARCHLSAIRKKQGQQTKSGHAVLASALLHSASLPAQAYATHHLRTPLQTSVKRVEEYLYPIQENGIVKATFGKHAANPLTSLQHCPTYTQHIRRTTRA